MQVKGRLTILTVDGGRIDRDLDGPPELQSLQDGVGGYIELVPPAWFDGYEGRSAAMFCNEEGKLMGLSINARACALILAKLKFIPDPIVGDVVIVSGDREFMEEL